MRRSPRGSRAGTSAEQTLTIQTGTGGTMLLAAGDLVYVNKPTSQAGLGVGNVRVSSSNTLGITFTNIPAAGGNITPTASQGYVVVALRGAGSYKLTATLEPDHRGREHHGRAVLHGDGRPGGDLLQVNKPTAQAGLDIGACTCRRQQQRLHHVHEYRLGHHADRLGVLHLRRAARPGCGEQRRVLRHERRHRRRDRTRSRGIGWQRRPSPGFLRPTS
jgi:hypothetical protein